MKVLLLENIKNLGQKGDIVNIKSGYARNYLIPFSKVLPFNSKNAIDLNKNSLNVNNDYENKINNSLNNTTIIIPVKLKNNKEIYGSFNSVKLSRIIKKLNLKLSIKNLRNNIFLKNIGNYKIEFKTKNENISLFIILVSINNEYK